MHKDHDQKHIAKQNVDTNIADLPNIKQVPRRSGRISKAKSVKSITMGSEISNFQAPFTVNIEISCGEEETVTVREVRRNVPNNIQNRRGDQGMGRQAGEIGQQEHAARQAGVTREIVGMAGGQQRDLGGATGASLAIPGCSSDGSQNNKGQVRKQNVTFVKAGNCHKAGCRRGTAGNTAVTGSSTQTLARTSKAGKT